MNDIKESELERFSLDGWSDLISTRDELRVLNGSYDTGNSVLGKSISVAVSKLLREEASATGIRELLRFPSYGPDYYASNSQKTHKLFVVQVTNLDYSETGYWSEIEFIRMPALIRPIGLNFKNYMKETCLAEPENGHTFSRRQLIELARNKAGAHSERKKGPKFEAAVANKASFDAIRNMEDGSTLWSSENPEAFRLSGSPLAAMMRTIAEECVEAVDDLVLRMENWDSNINIILFYAKRSRCKSLCNNHYKKQNLIGLQST